MEGAIVWTEGRRPGEGPCSGEQTWGKSDFPMIYEGPGAFSL